MLFGLASVASGGNLILRMIPRVQGVMSPCDIVSCCKTSISCVFTSFHPEALLCNNFDGAFETHLMLSNTSLPLFTTTRTVFRSSQLWNSQEDCSSFTLGCYRRGTRNNQCVFFSFLVQQSTRGVRSSLLITGA